jgi:hypothetical protein
VSQWLLEKAVGALDSARADRRSFLTKTAIVGSALAVAPLRYILQPGSAYAAICNCGNSACDCAAACCDGYTDFCCVVNGGHNECPPGSFAAGWWRADGSAYCGGTRYYVDCNATCTCEVCENNFCPSCPGTTCSCGAGRCDHRKVGCTYFRYGQCHSEISCNGPIVCRMVSCVPPYELTPACSGLTLVDDRTANHDAVCSPLDAAGIRRMRQARWFLRDPANLGVLNASFQYGDPGDIPIVGDWDGDGVATPGIVRGNQWFLRNSNSSGVADISFSFGDVGDAPIVGDWNGDGKAGIGVVRGNTWYLRNTLSSGYAEITLSFGDVGDVPIVGDWDGDGTDGIGVVRGNVWYLKKKLVSGFADLSFAYGDVGDVPIVGDWNADGEDGIGIVRRGTWHLRNTLSAGFAQDTFSFGDDTDIPLAGAWRLRSRTGPGVVR